MVATYSYLNKTFSVDLTYYPHFKLACHPLFIPGPEFAGTATHLKCKAAYLKQEGLGHIKVALASADTTSFLEILQAHFGQADLMDSNDEEDVPIKEEEGASEKIKEIGNLAKVELLFSMKSIPLITAGIPEDLLPLLGAETQSHYHCQAFQCGLDFSRRPVPVITFNMII